MYKTAHVVGLFKPDWFIQSEKSINNENRFENNENKSYVLGLTIKTPSLDCYLSLSTLKVTVPARKLNNTYYTQGN